MHAQNIGSQKFALRKPSESFDTGIVKKLRKFQYWTKKDPLIKKTCIHNRDVDGMMCMQSRCLCVQYVNIQVGKKLKERCRVQIPCSVVTHSV